MAAIYIQVLNENLFYLFIYVGFHMVLCKAPHLITEV